MFYMILFIILGITILLNIVAWMVPDFCDWYTLYIMPIWYNSYGRVMNVFDFSIGEYMIIAAIVLIAGLVIISIMLPILRKKSGFRSFVIGYYKIIAMIFVCVCLIMTLNCTILYHCSPIDPNREASYRKYSVDELEAARNHIVKMCNYYSERMNRDEKGYIIYEGDIEKYAAQALNGLSADYPKLAGYYPKVKHMMFSDLMSQAYIAGYYFPFSLEANCNSNMYIINYPEVYCHELSHLHGYIYEDEANFISFLACTKSEEEFFVYSGYMSVYNYINNAYMESLNGDMGRYNRQIKLNYLAAEDNIFLLPDKWDEVEEAAVLSTEIVNNASDTFIETSLHMNGVTDGMATYDKVVDLLLQYYDGVLY